MQSNFSGHPFLPVSLTQRRIIPSFMKVYLGAFSCFCYLFQTLMSVTLTRVGTGRPVWTALTRSGVSAFPATLAHFVSKVTAPGKFRGCTLLVDVSPNVGLAVLSSVWRRCLFSLYVTCTWATVVLYLRFTGNWNGSLTALNWRTCTQWKEYCYVDSFWGQRRH